MSVFQAFEALLVIVGDGCQFVDVAGLFFCQIEDAANSLVGFGVAFGGGGAHFGHVVLEQFHALRQGFVPFREPFEALVDGHRFSSIA